MKPVGPIPDGYQSVDGELAIGGLRASELVEREGRTPLFVYSRDLLSQRLEHIRTHIPDRIGINYAIKANPMADVIGHLDPLVDGFDIASAGELEITSALGIDAKRVSFAGPGKRDEELEAAILTGVTLNCESEGEAQRTLVISQRLGKKPRMALRVNPDFELKGSGMKMGGGAKPFGIDAAKVPLLAKRLISEGIEWRGLHIFTGSQALNAASIVDAQRNVIKLAHQLSGEIGENLPKLNMGGGFGIPYFPGDTALDLAQVGKALHAELETLPASLAQTELCLELGRYIAGEAGVYLCRVIDRKESHGVTYLVTDGGLHHQLAASGNFGTVVKRNYPIAIATKFASAPTDIANIVGCLCTPLDRLADQASIPAADIGDLVAVFCAGAYGASASPSDFLGHGPAAETMV